MLQRMHSYQIHLKIQTAGFNEKLKPNTHKQEIYGPKLHSMIISKQLKRNKVRGCCAYMSKPLLAKS